MCDRTFKPVLEDYFKFIPCLLLPSLSLPFPSLPFFPLTACSLLSFATYLLSNLDAAALCWYWVTTKNIMLLVLWEGTAVTLNPGCALAIYVSL